MNILWAHQLARLYEQSSYHVLPPSAERLLLMNTDISRWLVSTPAERTRDREVERVWNHAHVALARVSATTQVAQTAMLGTLSVSMMKREASMLVPEDAAKFDLIATQAALGMAAEINRLGR